MKKIIYLGFSLSFGCSDGEEILGDIIVSNCDPKSTFFCLVGSHNLDTDFIRRVKNYRMKGNVSNINLALGLCQQ